MRSSEDGHAVNARSWPDIIRAWVQYSGPERYCCIIQGFSGDTFREARRDFVADGVERGRSGGEVREASFSWIGLRM